MKNNINCLIIGSKGFLGKNLIAHLQGLPNIQIYEFSRENSIDELEEMISESNFIFHFAGINRPNRDEEFENNYEFTKSILELYESVFKNSIVKPPLIFTSSIQSSEDNPYGRSKRKAEKLILNLRKERDFPVHICRLPNVFGKWSKPNYNSVVATFCSNIARDIEIEIHDENKRLSLLYVDDLINIFLKLVFSGSLELDNEGFLRVDKIYKISLIELAEKIRNFKRTHMSLDFTNLDSGLDRALYSTYLSFLPNSDFSYELEFSEDYRGKFTELFKHENFGQISYFTTLPGKVRGNHYHHSKTEKFIVVQGEAKFKFVELFSGKIIEIFSNSLNPKVIQSIPGWAHNIENVGKSNLITIVWANEIFDELNPDTIQYSLDN